MDEWNLKNVMIDGALARCVATIAGQDLVRSRAEPKTHWLE